MARIIIGSYMVRYPLGGMLSCALQWIVGLQRLGHDVYFVEKSGTSDACFDPQQGLMSDDCTYGMEVLERLLSRFDLGGRWCHVDVNGQYYGMSRTAVEDLFASAALFVDHGTHGTWLPEARASGLRILVDGEPGTTQVKMAKVLATGHALPEYDAYYTVGQSVGTSSSTTPTAGLTWHPVFHPIVKDVLPPSDTSGAGAFTTVMNWRTREPLVFEGVTYGVKDAAFDEFAPLPTMVTAPMEMAVAGKEVPTERLTSLGWQLRDAHAVTQSVESFYQYIAGSRGEFSVAKHIFAAMNTGWFSDRSAAYLASGRPVVLQETGFSAHLPTGNGLFAVRSCAEAAAAIGEIEGDWARHSRGARDTAQQFLDSGVVLGNVMRELGIA